MYKILLGCLFLLLVGCASTGPNKEPLKRNYNELNVSIDLYQIDDKSFLNAKSDIKDKFIENITSHISDIPLETALSKVSYKIKDSHKFKMKPVDNETIGEQNVNKNNLSIGMLIFTERKGDLFVFNVFNRSNVNGAYANSLSEITMSFTDKVSDEIAYRVAENEILLIKIYK